MIQRDEQVLDQFLSRTIACLLIQGGEQYGKAPQTTCVYLVAQNWEKESRTSHIHLSIFLIVDLYGAKQKA